MNGLFPRRYRLANIAMRFEIVTLSILCLNLGVTFGKIRLIQVLLRHGDRAPGRFITTYPNDPNTNSTFFPEGLGGLTNAGKLRSYNLGKSLRSSYDEFLGEIYSTCDIEAISSDSERTRMTLMMVLMGLYPPAPVQQWNNNSDWQPVLASFLPKKEDTIFLPQNCEEYREEYIKAINSKEFQEQRKKLEPFMRRLTKDMGRESTVGLLDMKDLYHTLIAETSMNLTLPDWANKVYPKGPLRHGALLYYSLLGYNEELKKFSGGVVLKRIVENMKNAQNKTAKHKYKIHLYSGHETNVVMLLQSLGLYHDQIPEYNSGVIVELHELQNEYYVKVLYHKGVPAETDIVKIPGCDEMCPFGTFVELLADVIPTDTEFKCKKSKKLPTV